MKEQDREVLFKYRLKQAQVALEEAKLLVTQGKGTLGAVNRAYYAMFYAVLALLQKIGKVPKKHSGAISLFDTEFVKKGIFSKELSSHLHQAFEYRQVSDYQPIEMVSREDTEELIVNATNFLMKINEYLNNLPSI